MKDTYKTIANPSEEVLFKEKSSKFYGYVFPIQTEVEVKPILEVLRKQHPHAVHFCFAYKLGVEKVVYRANDDGEPSNSAGAPIYGQIQSFGLTNVLVVVVRIFGGTKLGVGGLIVAYKTTAQLALESSEIIEKTIDIQYVLTFDYINTNKVMRVLKEKKIVIISQKMEMNCEIQIVCRQKNASTVFDIFNSIYGVEIKLV